MRLRLPSSRGSFSIRLSLFDSVWAILAPLLALYFRDAQILSYAGLLPTIIYCSLSVVFSLIAFSAFRIHDGMTRYFSVHDAIDVTKAVAVAAFVTYGAVFTLTRLEGVPRSTPIIHALILLAGLIGVRIFTRLFEAKRTALVPRTDVAADHILMIGSNRLSLLYIKFIRAYSPGLHRIMAVLDDRPEMIGRAIDGVRVIGPADHLEPVVNEFAEHGVRINHVIVGGDPDMLSESILPEIRRICEEHQIRLDFVPELIGLQRLQPAQEIQIEPEPSEPATLDLTLPPYFVLKRFIDLVATMTIIVLLSPVWLLVGAVALWDVGSPIFFWQQRLGQGGLPFLLQKIRTLKPPFDWRGRKVPDAERLSVIGRFVRKCRFDELPQLLNVLVGDMSLIGPRPLLPRDQPPNPAVRLSIRPGITGWAQVNGGNFLSAQEKDALDEWYIRNASLRLDLRILFMTVQCVFQGERRSEAAIAAARAMRGEQYARRLSETLLMPVPATGGMVSSQLGHIHSAEIQRADPHQIL
jgi:lipopolysaccharide/colanic/teichoic acid biosynthesis glycosyltransferase